MKLPTMKVLINDSPVVINKDDFNPSVHVLYEESAQTPITPPGPESGVGVTVRSGLEPGEPPWDTCCAFAVGGHEIALDMKKAVEAHGLPRDGATLDKVNAIVKARDIDELKQSAANHGLFLHHATKNPEAAREKLLKQLKE